MKKSLFGDTGRFYKANLHGHTTVSDGHETPEEIKEIYKKAGYQILVYTDHDIMVDQSRLNDSEFLVMTGCEYEFNDASKEHLLPYSFVKTYHMLLFSPTAEVTCYPYGNPAYVWISHSKEYIQDFYKGNARHDFRIEDVNEMIRQAHEKGFLVCYNHPFWSTNSYPDYRFMEDVDFVECANSGCDVEGYFDDRTDRVYHDFLMLGRHCFPAASDDGHNMTNYTLAHTGIKADSLTYADVFKAMKEGRVYASWGPDFKDITYDPKTCELEVECTPVDRIYLITERRYCSRIKAEEQKLITSGTFDIREYIRDTYQYGNPAESFIRIVAVDEKGNLAVSPGWFVSDFAE